MLKIIKIGDVQRIVYVAKGFTTGLTNVTGTMVAPNKATTVIPWHGTDSTLGFCELVQGMYYYDWSTAGKAAGFWEVKIDSATKSNPAADGYQLVDGDTLDGTIFEKLDSMLDDIKASVESPVHGLPAISDDIAVVDGNVDDIEAAVSSGTFGLSAIKTAVDAIQSAVSSIGNSTKNTWATPSSVPIPTSGSITRRIYMNVFDNAGEMEDPDSNQIRVQVYNASSGADVTTQFLTGVEPVYMTRDAQGQYRIDYTIESTDTPMDLMFKHTYLEDTKTVVRQGIVNLGSAGDVMGKLNIIEGKIDVIDQNVDDIETLAGTINTKADTTIGHLTNATYGLSALQVDIEAVDSLIGAVQTDVASLKGAGWSAATDTLEAIRDRIDNALGVGFATGTDSLEAIRNAIDAFIGTGGTIETLIDNIEGILNTDVKGTGFAPATDSLRQLSLRTQSMATFLEPGGYIV